MLETINGFIFLPLIPLLIKILIGQVYELVEVIKK